LNFLHQKLLDRCRRLRFHQMLLVHRVLDRFLLHLQRLSKMPKMDFQFREK
jgi:hypothetical protein